MHIIRKIALLLFLCQAPNLCKAQNVNIDLISATNVDFKFDSFYKLTNGIFIANAITFNVEAIGTQWDLYMGSNTVIPGVWDNIQYYGTSGNPSPSVGIVQTRVHNLSNTPLISGFVPLQDIATSTLDIIGNHNAIDPAINCSDPSPTGTNTAGSALADPQCYQFRVDLRIVPGYNYRPGLYTLQIDFIIAPDL